MAFRQSCAFGSVGSLQEDDIWEVTLCALANEFGATNGATSGKRPFLSSKGERVCQFHSYVYENSQLGLKALKL